jgi:hypothetical protein
MERRHALDQRLDAGAARPDDAGLRAVEVLLEGDARIVVAGMRADDDRQLEDVADLARDLVMPARRRGAARRADAALRADEDLAAVVAPGLDLDLEPREARRIARPWPRPGAAPVMVGERERVDPPARPIVRAMRAAADAEIAVLGDDDAAAAGLKAPGERVRLGVTVPDDEDVVRAGPRRDQVRNV